jgi:hypothetical protein
MQTRETSIGTRLLFAACSLLLCRLALSGPAAAAGPNVQLPYRISIFAHSTGQYSQPDSIVQWRDSVLIGFGNGVSKTGSDPSTIVQYSLSGKVQRTFSVKGHNDGLRVKPETNELWALQNEDGNPNLVIIDLETGTQKIYSIPSINGGGGYDDVVFQDDQTFITASNPTLNGLNVNVFPALVRATLAGSTVNVEPVLNGDASGAFDIPTGAPVTLNLTDPDSLTVDPRGNLVLDSQGDSELVFIRHPFTNDQVVGRITITCPACPVSAPVPATVDDTAFASSSRRAFLLFSDLSNGNVYRIDSPPFGFEPGVAYSASDTAGVVGVLDLDNGVLTPIVTSTSTPLDSFRGMLFVVPQEDDEEDR